MLTFDPRPAPGELIRSDWMNRLVDAVAQLHEDHERLVRRVNELEAAIGAPKDGKVPEVKWREPYVTAFVERIRRQFEQTDDQRERVEHAYKLLVRNVDDLIDDREPGRPRPHEVAAWFHKVGIPVTEALEVLRQSAPNLATAIEEHLGKTGTDPLSYDAGVEEDVLRLRRRRDDG